MPERKICSLAAAVAAGLIMAAPAMASVWSGGNGTWNTVGSPGWDSLPGSVLAGAPGAIASKTDTTSATVNQNTGAAVTLGTANMAGAANSNAAAFTLTATNNITFDQDGAGVGFATISNTSTGTGNSTRMAIATGAGGITLADDLLISNSGTSGNASAISIAAAIGGAGNVTINNVSNTAAVSLTGANAFTGTVAVERGLVSYSSTTGLGNVANAVSLGSAGNSVTLLNTGTNTTSNNFTVAATVGTNTLGSTSNAGVTNTIFSGTILLNGNLSVTSAKTGTADVRFTNVISGVGNLTVVGAGEVQLGNSSTTIVNSYAGNTLISGAGPLVLSDNAALTFYIGASGVNNKVSGTANQVLTLDGDFVFDLTGAATSGSWTIVDVGTVAENFTDSFTVVGFSQLANVWTKSVGPVTYQFTESDGILTVVPEPASLGLLGLASLLITRRRR